MVSQNYQNLFLLIQRRIIEIFAFLAFFFIQISLSFLSIFSISQPYVMVIFIYIFIKKFKFDVSIFNLFFLGLGYDLMTGTNIGVHSLFFILTKVFIEVLENQFQFTKKYGDWMLFCLVYILSFTITKFIFSLSLFLVPDINAISFNIGFTLIIYPIIKFTLDIPKILIEFFYR